MKEFECLNCKKVFVSRDRGSRVVKFCSRSCAGVFSRGRKAWNSGTGFKKECKCIYCGKLFVQVRRDDKGLFCSLTCSRHKEAHNKGKTWEIMCKEKHPNWKGGVVKQLGYLAEKQDDGTYKRVHRQAVESLLGRKLKAREVVHHIDGDKTNNKIENLCLMRHQGAHKRLHHFIKRHNLDIKLFNLQSLCNI